MSTREVLGLWSESGFRLTAATWAYVSVHEAGLLMTKLGCRAASGQLVGQQLRQRASQLCTSNQLHHLELSTSTFAAHLLFPTPTERLALCLRTLDAGGYLWEGEREVTGSGLHASLLAQSLTSLILMALGDLCGSSQESGAQGRPGAILISGSLIA